MTVISRWIRRNFQFNFGRRIMVHVLKNTVLMPVSWHINHFCSCIGGQRIDRGTLQRILLGFGHFLMIFSPLFAWLTCTCSSNLWSNATYSEMFLSTPKTNRSPKQFPIWYHSFHSVLFLHGSNTTCKYTLCMFFLSL